MKYYPKRPHTPFIIFDRDGTLKHTYARNAFHMAFLRMAELAPGRGWPSDVFVPPPDNDEISRYFCDGWFSKGEITKPENYERLLNHRLEKTGNASRIDIPALAQEMKTLACNIESQAKLEEQILRQRTHLKHSLDQEMEDASKFYLNEPDLMSQTEERLKDLIKQGKIPMPKEGLNSKPGRFKVFHWQFKPPNVSDTEYGEMLDAYLNGDKEKACRMSMDFDQRREKAMLGKMEQELTETAVFPPYSMNMGFAPGALELLKELKTKGYKLALVTGGGADREAGFFSLYETQQFERELGCSPDKFFDHMGAVATGSNKTFAYRKAMREVNAATDDTVIIRARSTVAVGDLAEDAQAGNRLGMHTVLVDWQKTLDIVRKFEDRLVKKRLEAEGTVFTNSLEEVREVIPQILARTGKKTAIKSARPI